MSARKKLMIALCCLPALLLGLYLSALAGPAAQPVPPVAQDPVGALAPGRPQRAAAPASAPAATASSRYVTLSPRFPAITVTTPANNTASGFVFVSPFNFTPPIPDSHLLILDNAGQPVYYQYLNNNQTVEFKVLPDGTLAYWDLARNAFVILDSSYQEIGTVRTGNGLTELDAHELQLLDNGHYLIMATQNVAMDMSQVTQNGNPNAQVVQQVIQEVDRAGNVYWDWPILQYIPVTATNQPLTSATIDYSHCNAIAVDTIDTAGNLLYSCRHLSAIVKINRSTRQIMWQLGGKGNNFTFIRGQGISQSELLNFYYQHDIRRQPDPQGASGSGHITLFDNHNDPGPQISRGLEYQLDEQNMTATLVRALHNTPDVYAPYMGNVQVLPNGNVMMGWGGNLTPSLTEFHADGSKAFELDFADPLISYRAFRFPWTGHPTWPPALVLQPSGSALNLTFSWNGATDVASYRIFGGNALPVTQVLAEQPKTGFETSATLNGADAAYCFYQVVPVNSQGQAQIPSALGLNAQLGDSACFHKLSFPLVQVP